MPENGKENPTRGEQRKLAAVMFTDIVGYSRRMHGDEAGALEFLSVHNTVVQEQVASHGGRVIKAIGDSLMVDFKSVVDAVNCAVSIQARFHKRNRALKPDQRMYVRVGIHLGDVVVTKDDIFGDGVNIASRLVPLSPHGGICVSREVETHLRSMKNLKVNSRGLRFLKNISRPVEIFRVWGPGMDPAAGRRFQFLRGKTQAYGTAAAGVLVLAAVLLPPWLASRGLRGWDPWLVEDFRDWQGFSERWQAPSPSEGREGWLVLKKPVPSRAFRVKAVYRVPPGGKSDLALAALVMGKEGEFLFFRRKADPSLKWVNEQVGLKRGERMEDEAVGSRPQGSFGQVHWQTLTYESGRLKGESGSDRWLDRLLPGRKTLSTWVRQAPAGAIFRFALRSGDARLERLEIHFKEAAGEKDMAERAEAYALAGRFETALKLYDDLFNRAGDAEKKCSHLYRQALVHRCAGRMTEALDLYYRILKTFPENLYSGYARMDLGLLEGTKAFEVEGEAETRRHAEQAHGYFSGLLKRAPDHPEAERAAFLLVKNDMDYLGAGKEEREAALEILRSGGPYAQRALDLLLEEGSDLPKAWAVVEPLLKKGKLRGPLFEKAVGAQAEAYRLSNRMTDLSELVEKACRSGKYGLGARRAVVKQWVAAEEGGLSAGKSKALMERLAKRSKAARAFEKAYLFCDGEAMAQQAWESLRKAVKVEVKDGGDKAPRRREYMDWVQGEFIILGGVPGAAVLPREEGGLRMAFNVPSIGQDLVIEPGVGPFSAKGDSEGKHKAVDLRFYRRVTFKAKFPKGRTFRVCLAEPGAGDPREPYHGPGPADGEQYELASFTGKGDWRKYQVELLKPDPELTWGNQEGDLRLSLGTVGAVVFSIPEGEGKGVLELRDLFFER